MRDLWAVSRTIRTALVKFGGSFKSLRCISNLTRGEGIKMHCENVNFQSCKNEPTTSFAFRIPCIGGSLAVIRDPGHFRMLFSWGRATTWMKPLGERPASRSLWPGWENWPYLTVSGEESQLTVRAFGWVIFLPYFFVLKFGFPCLQDWRGKTTHKINW